MISVPPVIWYYYFFRTQRVEQQERDDEMAIPKVSGSKAGGKGGRKQKVLMKEETKPSPYGRRVQPRIDPALLKKQRVPGAPGAKKGRKVC